MIYYTLCLPIAIQTHKLETWLILSIYQQNNWEAELDWD